MFVVLSDKFIGAEPGDEVDLDPDVVNVRALVKAGLVAALPPKVPAKKAAAKRGEG